MAAIRRPENIFPLPYGLGHGRGNDGVVAGGKSKNGALKVCFSVPRVPMHQPIEPLIEPGDIERLGIRVVGGAAGPPKRTHRAARIAGQAPLQRGNPGRRHMGTEAVEPLDADQAFEAVCFLLQEPQHAERVADGDGILRPRLLAFRPTGDEAEIDQGDIGPAEMRDEFGPDPRVKPQP
ncbi:hypothetical protein AUC69_06595 [Methyloceanibacter superfactus]|uniref:Uncharacterized protein n=1 Tax=Methyloceanibacter superfactus TaxID=1774969 RepID=A0A1E3W6U7_9HYPH|nr:hypothetical protein AUC69_06595 [Methyloceanibacter superfactus]